MKTGSDLEKAKIDPPHVADDHSLSQATSQDVTLTGTRDKDVTCERCGHHYQYTLQRTAIEPTKEGAEVQLAQELDRACDVVPCPACGALTRRMRKERLRYQLGGAGLVGMGSVLCAGSYFPWRWIPLVPGIKLKVLAVGFLLFLAGYGLYLLWTGFLAILTLDEPDRRFIKPTDPSS